MYTDVTNLNIENISKAYFLANYNRKNKSSIFINKGVSLVDRITTSCQTKGLRTKEKIEIPLVLYYGMRYMIEDAKETHKKKEIVRNLFSLSKKDVTGDFTSLLDANGKIKAFVNDFDYSAAVSDNVIKNIEIFWGNLNLEKLHDFSKLESLKIVIGDLYTLTGTNREWLSNIDAVTGNIYTSDDEIIEQAKNILYVGGSIYNNKNGETVKVNIKR